MSLGVCAGMIDGMQAAKISHVHAERSSDRGAPLLGHLAPLRHGAGGDLQCLRDGRDGPPALAQLIPCGISHAGHLSVAKTTSQQETKTDSAGPVWHQVTMRDISPKALAIGHRMKLARENAGVSQPRLANLVGVTKGAVGQYETGRAIPRPERLEAIAAVLNVSVEWLLTGDEPDELVKAQTSAELELLRLLRTIPANEHDTALAVLAAMAAQAAKRIKKS